MEDSAQFLDHLPHVDSQPSSEELAASLQLIASERSHDNSAPLHPAIHTEFQPRFSAVINAAHESIDTTGKARSNDAGIDLTRYDEPSAPESPNATRQAWQIALRQAYISHSYLAQRQLNLSLLERFGKNAWLIANDQIETELKAIEKDLAAMSASVQQLTDERLRSQSRVKGELDGLEETWKVAVGRAIETEVAVESLRRQLLDKRRSAV